jgi:hypothetical protein
VLANGTFTAAVPAALADGTYTVTASVIDAAGNTATATDQTAVDTAAPAVVVDAPAVTNDTTLTITGTTDAPVGATVTLTIGGQVFTTSVLSGGVYSVAVPLALADGSYTSPLPSPTRLAMLVATRTTRPSTPSRRCLPSMSRQ